MTATVNNKRTHPHSVSEITYDVIDQRFEGDLVSLQHDDIKFESNSTETVHIRINSEISNILKSPACNKSFVINALIKYAIDDLSKSKKRLIITCHD